MKQLLNKFADFYRKITTSIKNFFIKLGIWILSGLQWALFGISWFFYRVKVKNEKNYVITFGFIPVRLEHWNAFWTFFVEIKHTKGGTDQLVIFKFMKFKLTNRRREAIIGYLFIGVWIIGFLWLTLVPLITSLQYSFFKITFSGDQGIQLNFVGFDNYVEIFNQLTYFQALQDFVYRTVLYLPLILILAMILAILLNQKIKLRGFFRSVFFLPVIVASGPIMTTLLGTTGDGGLLAITSNDTLTAALANTLPPFLAEFVGSMFTHLISILWFSGVQIILFLAGLQKVNREVYEAASIDGASPWETFWKITLPSLKSIILVAAIYTIVMLATFPTNLVLIRINEARRSDYGYASALSWVYFLIIGVILGIVAFLLTYEKKTIVKKQLMEVKR